MIRKRLSYTFSRLKTHHLYRLLRVDTKNVAALKSIHFSWGNIQERNKSSSVIVETKASEYSLRAGGSVVTKVILFLAFMQGEWRELHLTGQPSVQASLVIDDIVQHP